MILTTLLAVSLVPGVVPADDGGPHRRDEECAEGLRAANDRGPAAGAAAPEFKAWSFDPETGAVDPTSSSDLMTGRPLILAFGSYT